MRSSSSPLSAVSSQYVQELEAQYRADPDSIDPGWRCVFDVLRELETDGAPQSTAALESLIVSAYRQSGHLAANLDPLGLSPGLPMPEIVSSAPSAYGALIERLRSIYCGPLAVETAHIDEPALRAWIQAAFEGVIWTKDPERDRKALQRLIAAQEFEHFMGVKFPAKKRFGAEGAETLIPLMDRLLQNAATSGVTDIVIGTMHRGRLNVVGNVLGKPIAPLIAEFKGMHPVAAESLAAADVPYHLGHETELLIENRKLKVTLVPNPSHLEAVNAVVLGRVRARQMSGGDPRRVLGIVMHTDASVIAQGVVGEMLQLSRLDGFSTAGTVHIIVNNQIGFTTERHEARTSYHCTGLWKAIDCLILHANADYPEAALRAADLAFDFRQAHGRDAVIDLVCYRRNGHNEVDEPRFTQPLIYRAIDSHPSVAALFGSRLADAGMISAAEIAALALQERAKLAQAYENAEELRASAGDPGGDTVVHDASVIPAREQPVTGIPLDKLQELLTAVSSVPGEMTVNQKIGRIVKQRAQSADAGVPWPVAEALAFAGLLVEGTSVRLCGQDAVRGAFSQRHLSLIDAQTGARHRCLDDLGGTRARFEAINSPLSEYAVLGFEYGYSVERPEALVIWEAQFGDFANGAQIIIDQLVASGEEKWRQASGLVMLLPHGLEGQGPEHSSGRLERFLQLCAKDNLRVAQPSTPANYFHLLRRQIHGQTPKPLVVMSPKSLLRLPAAVSPLGEFGPATAFKPVIVASFGARVSQVLLCSGKIAYDLEREREARSINEVSIVRVEELYPFPAAEIERLVKDAPSAQFTWVQEEPRNLGAWNFMDRRLEAVLEQAGVRYPRISCISRPESASPAGSFHGNHERDQRRIVDAAFSWATKPAGSLCAS